MQADATPLLGRKASEPEVSDPVVGRGSWIRDSVPLCIALLWLGLVALCAVLADVLPGLADPLQIDPAAIASPPSGQHLLGADELGRDMFSRVVHGARTSLLVGAGVVVVAGTIGGLLGVVAGYVRGRVGGVIMGLMDSILSFPALVLALALTAFLGASTQNLIIAISVLAVPAFARVSRSRSLTLSTRDFILAARTIGLPHWRVVTRELIPNILPTIGTYALLVIALAIVVEGSLSFLGLGIPPPAPSWGAMISSGKGHLATAPHIALIPSVMLLLTVLALNVLGERLRTRYSD